MMGFYLVFVDLIERNGMCKVYAQRTLKSVTNEFMQAIKFTFALTHLEFRQQ